MAGKSKPATDSADLVLICGEDEYSVKRRAKQIFEGWVAASADADQDIVDAAALNASEALTALARLHEALQTLPFFGGAKLIWFRNCSFLGDDRAASSQGVTAGLAELSDVLKNFQWNGVRLLISAGKVDKRKSFYKTLGKIGAVETFDGWNLNARDWQSQAEGWARSEIGQRGKRIAPDALSLLIESIGPDSRQLSSEIEKLCLYLGDEEDIRLRHIEEITTRNKQARAFALGDALGDRDVPRLLRTLSEEMWSMKTDKQKSEIGLLYGLILKVRSLLMLKEMLNRRMISPKNSYPQFQDQWKRLPADAFPADKRYNPATMSPYIFYKAIPQARRFSSAELVIAMEKLLKCNVSMVSSSTDSQILLQQTLIEIANGT